MPFDPCASNSLGSTALCGVAPAEGGILYCRFPRGNGIGVDLAAAGINANLKGVPLEVSIAITASAFACCNPLSAVVGVLIR
jgi:hypothetical protein